MITQCCVQALYALGKEHQHETEIAKSFERRKCNHRTAIDPNECLKDVIGESASSGGLELGRAWDACEPSQSGGDLSAAKVPTGIISTSQPRQKYSVNALARR